MSIEAALMCVLGRAYALVAHTSRMGAAIGKADTPRGNHVQRRSTERLYLGAPMPAAYGFTWARLCLRHTARGLFRPRAVHVAADKRHKILRAIGVCNRPDVFDFHAAGRSGQSAFHHGVRR